MNNNREDTLPLSLFMKLFPLSGRPYMIDFMTPWFNNGSNSQEKDGKR
jgi:hypothetical protein